MFLGFKDYLNLIVKKEMLAIAGIHVVKKMFALIAELVVERLT